MKKFILTALGITMLISCQYDDDFNTDQSVGEVSDSNPSLKICASDEVFQRQLRENPQMAHKVNEIENFTEMALQQGKLINGKIQIPVVVNVLYNTAAQNISLTQIQSQIDILNKDFSATNTDFGLVPAQFSAVKANIGISFVLDVVNRKYTTRTSWGTTNDIKKTLNGGLNPTSPTTKLNFWVGTIGNNIGGYAQFPGGPSATDGIVVDPRFVGLSGTASYPYNLGRVATHEVGHWLNLRHIWGDTACGTDYVADTPTHNAANNGSPTFPHYSTCAGQPIEMTMNYMDYTVDAAKYMFTNGQKSRINAIFVAGGPRYSFAQP